MSIKARALASAVLLAVAVAGCQSAASSAPSMTTIPSALSSAAAAADSGSPALGAGYPSWYTAGGNGAGILPAGNGTTRDFDPGFTFTVPEGWVNDSDEAGVFGLFPDTPANQAEFAASGNLANAIFLGPLDSPYFVCKAWEDNRGATAAEMVAKVVANDAIAASDPLDVTIGGLRGKQVDIQVDPATTDTCPGDAPGSDLGDGRTRAILLDSPIRGVIVIFVGSLHSAGHEAFLAEAMPIIESIQFGGSL